MHSFYWNSLAWGDEMLNLIHYVLIFQATLTLGRESNGRCVF